MANRFSTGNDYSQTFMYLYEQNQRSMEAAVARQDARRESELAAKDSLVFTRWQEGKISGAELMAYINQRMRQSAYDPAQQKKWREAAITYGTQIADDQAEADYAQSGNISALIGHYAGRLSQTKRGTPEYLELTKRLSSLREQRDTDNLRKQAKRISRAIERGDATTKDLIAFYREQLQTLPAGSPLREQVRDTLSQLRVQERNDQFQSQMTQIDSQLATGHMSPQEAARQKQQLLQQFDIETRDPTNFWVWQEEIRRLRATPDPAAVAKLEFDFANGTVSPEQYIAQIDRWAMQIAPFDLEASWQLRTEAQKLVDGIATPLPRPGALGMSETGPGSSLYGGGYSGAVEVVRRLPGSLRHITQFDSSKFSSTNCAMASGAMLAHAMGAQGLTGADLRYITGDVSGGTNVTQLQAALGNLGIKNTSLENNIGFEQFKQRLAGGSPAVLQGWGGNVPTQLRGRYGDIGHGIFVAGYDPKRDAFLVLDPAGHKRQGIWWPSVVMQNFGWATPGYGQALFAPSNTVDPKTLERVGGKIKYISVDERGSLPSTPSNAGGQFDPGPQTSQKLQDAMARKQRDEDRRLQRRLRDAGIEPGPELDTVQEVEEELERRWKSYNELDETIQEWIAGYAQDGEDVQEVVIGGSRTTLSREDIGAMQSELLSLVDGQELFYNALDDGKGAADARKLKTNIVTDGVSINSISAQVGIARLEREAQATLVGIQRMTDPLEIMTALGDLDEILVQLGDVETARQEAAEAQPWNPFEDGVPEQVAADRTEVEEQQAELKTGVAPEITKQRSYYLGALEVIRNPELTRDERITALVELGDQFDIGYPTGWPDGTIKDFTGDLPGRIIAEAFQKYDETMLLRTADPDLEAQGFPDRPMGEALIIDGELVVLPTKQTNRQVPTPDGGTIMVPDRVMDPAYLPKVYLERMESLGYKADDLPLVVIRGSDGELVHRRTLPTQVPYEGIDYLVWGNTKPDNLPKGLTYEKGQPLTEDDLSHPFFSGYGAFQTNIASRVLDPRKLMVERIILPGPRGATSVWYKDPGTRRWHEGNLPFIGRASTGIEDANFGHGYTGMRVDQQTGQAWPELDTDTNIMDYTTMGVAVPFQKGIDPMQAGQYVQAQERAGLRIDPLRVRDIDDPMRIIEYSPDDDEYTLQWARYSTIQSIIVEQQKARAEAMSKLMTVNPEQAAEAPFLTDMEKRERARVAGIDYDTGEWLPGTDPLMAQKPPSQEMLQEFGIDVGQTVEEAKPKASLFDPVKSALDTARGVIAANKADLERRKAEAASATKVTSSLPKVTVPKAPAPKPQTQLAPLPQSTAKLPTSGAAHATRTRPPVTPTPAPTPYVAPKPVMDEHGQTALGGGR